MRAGYMVVHLWTSSCVLAIQSCMRIARSPCRGWHSTAVKKWPLPVSPFAIYLITNYLYRAGENGRFHWKSGESRVLCEMINLICRSCITRRMGGRGHRHAGSRPSSKDSLIKAMAAKDRSRICLICSAEIFRGRKS